MSYIENNDVNELLVNHILKEKSGRASLKVNWQHFSFSLSSIICVVNIDDFSGTLHLFERSCGLAKNKIRNHQVSKYQKDVAL